MRAAIRSRITLSTSIAAFAALLLASVTAAGEPEGWPSRDGLYRLSYTSELAPLDINRIHRWTLILTDAAGRPVSDADISVTGGMPQHDHGLPTSPRVTRALGEGRYLLEGMRFHMRGVWELTFTIDAAAGSDTVFLAFEL